MAIIGDISGIGEAASGIGSIAKIASDTLFRLFPSLDKQDAAKAAQEIELKVLDQQQAQMEGQIEVNKVEAANPSLFVAGWRPAVGWCCAIALSWNFVFGPILLFIFAAFGVKGDIFPRLDSGELMNLTVALLGLGVFKTIEHVQGVEPGAQGTKTTVTKEVRKALPVTK